MAETPLSKEAICREYIRLGTALPKEATAARVRLGALQVEAEAVAQTDMHALRQVAEKLATYQQEGKGRPKSGESLSPSPAASHDRPRATSKR